MQLSELKLISASNIIRLRTQAGFTQAELGEKLNYSDKTISKWERGEAIPDAYVLTQMAEIFGVTVDYLLSTHDAWENPNEVEDQEQGISRYSANVIIAIAVLGVWTMALSVFVLLWLLGYIVWQSFVVALPVSILTYMVLICVFNRRSHLQFVIAAFVLSMFACRTRVRGISGAFGNVRCARACPAPPLRPSVWYFVIASACRHAGGRLAEFFRPARASLPVRRQMYLSGAAVVLHRKALVEKNEHFDNHLLCWWKQL